MQGGGDIRYFSGRAIILAALALPLAALPCLSAAKIPGGQSPSPNHEAPIQIPKESAPKGQKEFVRALMSEPLQVRGVVIDVPEAFVRFFIERPALAHKIAREILHKTPFTLDHDEESGELTLKGSGAKYILARGVGKKMAPVAWFKIVTPNPLSASSRLAGYGVMALRIRQGEDDMETEIDYDLRVAPAEGRYGSIEGGVELMLRGAAARDMAALVEALAEVCEEAMDDPALLAGDMEAEEESFTREEIAEFNKRFIKGAAKPR